MPTSSTNEKLEYFLADKVHIETSVDFNSRYERFVTCRWPVKRIAFKGVFHLPVFILPYNMNCQCPTMFQQPKKRQQSSTSPWSVSHWSKRFQTSYSLKLPFLRRIIKKVSFKYNVYKKYDKENRLKKTTEMRVAHRGTTNAHYIPVPKYII